MVQSASRCPAWSEIGCKLQNDSQNAAVFGLAAARDALRNPFINNNLTEALDFGSGVAVLGVAPFPGTASFER
jgi:hypothetical protein